MTTRLGDGKRTCRGKKTNQTKRRTSALLRDALPNTPLPRHRQPTINQEKLDAYLAAVAKFVDDRNRDLAELRKSRLKLDEIVHILNTGTDAASIMNIIESTVQECRLTFAEGTKALGDFKEVFARDDEASGPERLTANR